VGSQDVACSAWRELCIAGLHSSAARGCLAACSLQPGSGPAYAVSGSVGGAAVAGAAAGLWQACRVGVITPAIGSCPAAPVQLGSAVVSLKGSTSVLPGSGWEGQGAGVHGSHSAGLFNCYGYKARSLITRSLKIRVNVLRVSHACRRQQVIRTSLII
jgi:hypothetical protein